MFSTAVLSSMLHIRDSLDSFWECSEDENLFQKSWNIAQKNKIKQWTVSYCMSSFPMWFPCALFSRSHTAVEGIEWKFGSTSQILFCDKERSRKITLDNKSIRSPRWTLFFVAQPKGWLGCLCMWSWESDFLLFISYYYFWGNWKFIWNEPCLGWPGSHIDRYGIKHLDLSTCGIFVWTHQ